MWNYNSVAIDMARFVWLPLHHNRAFHYFPIRLLNFCQTFRFFGFVSKRLLIIKTCRNPKQIIVRTIMTLKSPTREQLSSARLRSRASKLLSRSWKIADLRLFLEQIRWNYLELTRLCNMTPYSTNGIKYILHLHLVKLFRCKSVKNGNRRITLKIIFEFKLTKKIFNSPPETELSGSSISSSKKTVLRLNRLMRLSKQNL